MSNQIPPNLDVLLPMMKLPVTLARPRQKRNKYL